MDLFDVMMSVYMQLRISASYFVLIQSNVIRYSPPLVPGQIVARGEVVS